MIQYALGFGLMLVGLVMFIAGRALGKRRSVNASGGSVAVGGSNSGPITNANVGATHKHNSALTVTSIVVELLGIAVVIWHAVHLAAR
jgi:hypothetical protein